MLKVNITADEAAIRQLNDRLSFVQDKIPDILLAGGVAASKFIRWHLRRLGNERHVTADRLGANPTGHYKASDVSAPRVSGDTVSISVSTPGLSRAYHDVVIRPVEAKALAIPLHADAYGFQPRELTNRGVKFFRMLKRGERKGGELQSTLFRQGSTGPEPMYLLAAMVHQDQDPTLMPSDQDLSKSFTDEVSKAINSLWAAVG